MDSSRFLWYRETFLTTAKASLKKEVLQKKEKNPGGHINNRISKYFSCSLTFLLGKIEV